MTISMYSASVPIFKQLLNSLSAILIKAEIHSGTNKIDPDRKTISSGETNLFDTR